MAEHIEGVPSVTSFDYELYEGDPDHLRTVVATPNQPGPWIDPSALKLKHRIGRGSFGDVWLATHHQVSTDYEEFHEVAVKMMRPIKEDCVTKFLNKFEELFLKLRGLRRVCWLHGYSVISGKICLAMKYYEGSVGDRMAWLKGGKLPLPDVLRYGLELGKGILELHSLGIMVLNLKPTNILLNEQDQVYVGDFGIPYLLLGLQLPEPDLALRLGSPNYMAPEQWEPEVRGPITLETDSWGFGCCIVEMLTGNQPFFGKSVDEIYKSVVIKQEKPQIPSGLPAAIENVIGGCFEYDVQNRPRIEDIVSVFESSRNAVYNDGEWAGTGGRTLTDKSSPSSCYSIWFLIKDHLHVGDTVRSRKTSNCRETQSMFIPLGTVVGLEKSTEREGSALVRVQGIHDPLRVNITTLERVTDGLSIGDWVKLREENLGHSMVGILHYIDRDGNVEVGFLGLETVWKGNSSKLQMAERFCVGHFVRLKENVYSPRFPWVRKSDGKWATGRVAQTLPNGCLVVKFPGTFNLRGERNVFLADPSEVERVSFEKCVGLVEKYRHAEDFHWSVRPLAIAFCLFTMMKVGFFVGHSVGVRLKKGKRAKGVASGGGSGPGDGGGQEGQSGGNKSRWLPPPVANILSREGGGTSK